jgi:hypothetical protein
MGTTANAASNNKEAQDITPPYFVVYHIQPPGIIFIISGTRILKGDYTD